MTDHQNTGGNPKILHTAESARPCRALTMKFELARIIRLCTQLLVGYLWPIIGRKGSYHDGQALPEVFYARNCQPGTTVPVCDLVRVP